jgi:hypothetical protein
MNRQHEALDPIERAGRRVKEAADGWNAVDLAAIGLCVSALEESAGELTEATEILKRSPATQGGAFRTTIRDLKAAVARLERLVDFSSAFLRGAPGVVCDDSGLYQAGGSMRRATTAGNHGMQV